MRPRLLLLVLLLAATGGALWLAVAQRAAAHTAERQHAELRQQHGRLRIEIEAAERRLMEHEAEQARLARAPVAPPPGPVPGALRRATVLPVEEFKEYQQRVANDPKLQTDHIERHRRRLAGEYATLLDALNLPEAQASRFVENLVTNATRFFELSIVEVKQPGLLNEATVQRYREESEREFYAAQRTLLGEAGYQQYDRYRRTLPLRLFVDDMAGKAALAGAPISAAEADALLAAMIDASPSYRAGQMTNTTAIEWQAVADLAEKILAPPQLAVFQGRVIPIWYRERLNALARQP